MKLTTVIIMTRTTIMRIIIPVDNNYNNCRYTQPVLIEVNVDGSGASSEGLCKEEGLATASATQER